MPSIIAGRRDHEICGAAENLKGRFEDPEPHTDAPESPNDHWNDQCARMHACSDAGPRETLLLGKEAEHCAETWFVPPFALLWQRASQAPRALLLGAVCAHAWWRPLLCARAPESSHPPSPFIHFVLPQPKDDSSSGTWSTRVVPRPYLVAKHPLWTAWETIAWVIISNTSYVRHMIEMRSLRE